MGSHWEKYETDEASGNKIKVHIMELHILKKDFQRVDEGFHRDLFLSRKINYLGPSRNG